MVWVNVLLSIVTIALGIVLYIKKCLNYWNDLGIPSDQMHNPLGHLKGVGTVKHITDVLHDVYYRYRNISPVTGIYFLFKPTLVVNDLDVVKSIMVKDFNNFEDRGVYFNDKDDPLSGHLFNIEGQKWRALRQTMSPTFTSGKMKYMFPTIMTVGDRFQKKMIEVVNKKSELEIKDWVARFTTDVIGVCAFGIDCNCLNDPDAIFRKMGRKVFEEPSHSQFVFLLMDNFKALFRFFKAKSFSDEVINFFVKVVDENVRYREENKIRKKDFMDIMIELRNEGKASKGLTALTDAEIQAQAFVFYLAGFETSSTLLTFCIYELCLNPDIQEKTRQYMNEAIANNNNELTYELFHDMKYVEQVLNEALRKYPPVPLLVRHCKNNYKIGNTKLVIPKGVNCIIPIESIQNDHEIFPNPQKFDPDRFSDEVMATRHQFAHLPFGEGPRNCIGMRFGMLQAKIALTLLLTKFRISLSNRMETPVPTSKNILVPTPIGGMRVVMEEIAN